MTIILKHKANNYEVVMLKHGWETGCAKRMKCCKKTIYNIIQTGVSHPRHAEMIKIAIENFKK